MIDINDSIKKITKDGFVDLTGLIASDTIGKLSKLISRPFSVTHNNGRRGYIKMGNQHFLANTLSWGKEIIDIYTNPKLINLCEQYTGEPVHLSNFRIYKTLPSKDFNMGWHVDNKIDKFNYDTNSFDVEVVSADKGLIIIMYLVDVEEGGVQLVKGSHKWSREHTGIESFDDFEPDFIDNIVTFNHKPKGTLIAYDYATIHRAAPYIHGNVRMSLFGQYSPSWMPTGEPILLHSRDLANLSEKQKQVLSFGHASSTENWPIGQACDALDDNDVDQILSKVPKIKLLKNLLKRR